MLNAILKRIIELFSKLLGDKARRHYMWKCSYQTFQGLGLKNPLVLDVGCGDGRNIMTHRDLMGDFIGLDLDPEALKEARARGVPVVLGEATRLPFKTGCFDVVTSFHLIEHIEDDLTHMNEIYRVLKDSGYAIIMTPNRRRLHMLIYKFITRIKERCYPMNPLHVFEYTKADFESLFSKSNFRHYQVNPVGLISLPGLEIPWSPRFLSKYCYVFIAVLQAMPEKFPKQGH